MPNEITSVLTALVGDGHVRVGSEADAVRGVTPAIVVEPADDQGVADVLRAANAADLAVVPRGGGTKLDWGNAPARADVVLSTRRLNRVISHAWADLTVIVEAGCTMAALQRTLRAHGQRVAIDPLWPEHATIGGVLASNDSGALRLRFGALRDLIIGVTLALPDGTVATSGGRVVKNVAGYDLPKLATGALGTLGVITRAIFRLHPLPRHSRTLSIPVTSLDAAQRIVEAIQDSRIAHTALQLRAARSEGAGIDVLFEGSEAGIAAQTQHLVSLAGAVAVSDAAFDVWGARERLWSLDPHGAVLKLSVPMTEIAAALGRVQECAAVKSLDWRAVFYATGLGWIALSRGSGAAARVVMEQMRSWASERGGSLVMLRADPGAMPLDTWGGFGDAEGLMQAVRREFDPKGTINPGRFIDPPRTQ